MHMCSNILQGIDSWPHNIVTFLFCLLPSIHFSSFRACCASSRRSSEASRHHAECYAHHDCLSLSSSSSSQPESSADSIFSLDLFPLMYAAASSPCTTLPLTTTVVTSEPGTSNIESNNVVSWKSKYKRISMCHI